jgi:DNA modification methylase
MMAKKPTAKELAHISRDLRPLARQVVRLKVDPRNARTHDKRNIEAIRASLERYGQQKPIVLRPDGKTVAAGSGTLEAAWLLGWTWIAAIRFDRDPEIAAAYGLADNRTAELAAWDNDILSELLQHYRDTEGDGMELPGWTEAEIGRLLSKETVEDQVPAPPAAPVSVLGEVYELGPHRVLCGDSTAPEAVSALLGAVVPFLMVTDPPYGVTYDAAWRNRVLKPYNRREGEVENDDSTSWGPAYALFDGDVAYVWHASLMTASADQLRAAGFELRSQIIWRKPSLVVGRGAYHWQHESCWYAVRKGKKAWWAGDRKQATIWDVPHVHRTQGTVDDAITDHSTQKPVEIMARPMRNHGKPGDIVYDPFLGSGTTLIAAEQTGRTCYGIEIDPGYCDVIRQRYANFVKDASYSPTGKLDG